MSEFINLAQAAQLIAKITDNPFSANNTMQFIMAGAEGKIPVYWRNSAQKFSALLGFSKKVDERPRAVRWMQVSFIDLSRLEVAETIETGVFYPTSDDLEHLLAIGGEDANRVITEKSAATVSREQLYVCEPDVSNLAVSQLKGRVPAATSTETPAPTVTNAQAVVEAPDPERRLAALRALGGSSKWRRDQSGVQKWQFTGIQELVDLEKAERRKRSDEKTIRGDLREAAETESMKKRNALNN